MIEERWQFYKEKAYPHGTSEAHEDELRRAFFAGATSLWLLYLGLCCLEDDEVIAAMDALNAELEDTRLSYIAEGLITASNE